MLHEFSTVLLSSTFADANPTPAVTLQITIVTGIVTIVVSLIGVWGTKASRARKEKPATETATAEERLEAEIERLERICYEWDIDPKNGHTMKHRTHSEGGRHAIPSSEPS